MEMEKSYYVVTFKPGYFEMIKARSAGETTAILDESHSQRVVIGITQGGFGQDIVDDERQAKERFLEYLFFSSDIDLPREAETFDEYFDLQPIDELIDLDEEF